MRRRWRSVFPAHANTGDPNGPVRGLSANQLECALISMMARSTTRSNQRPDTLMQDRICQVDETSCNARPDHTFGSLSDMAARSLNVCFTARSRHRRRGPQLRRHLHRPVLAETEVYCRAYHAVGLF